MKVTENSIHVFYTTREFTGDFKNPVLQLIAASKGKSNDTKCRYRGVVSDGKHKMKCVLSSEISLQLENKTLKVNDLIRLKTFEVRQNDTQRYMLISTILETIKEDDIIGEPREYTAATKENKTNGEEKIAKRKESVDSVKVQKPSETNKKYTLLKEINPFAANWCIKARVLSKSQVRMFKTKTGDGKLFSFDLLDSSSQIKVIAFNQAVDTFFPIIQTNKVYEISHGAIKMANKKFSNIDNDYEIQLEENSIVTAVEDNSIPEYCFKFTEIKNLTKDIGYTDFVGVIKEVYERQSITVKTTGKETTKRDLYLVDPTGSIRITLWGEKAESEFEIDTVCCFKNVKVGEYNDAINLSTMGSSQIYLNCDVPEAIKMMIWYNNEGRNMVVEQPKRKIKRQLIRELVEIPEGYGSIFGTIMFVKETNMYYSSCPNEGCMKKVIQEDVNSFRCESCNEAFETCKYRYMVSLNVSDFTGQFWVSVFDEAAEKLFGCSAAELNTLKENNDADEAAKVVKNVLGKEYQMRLRLKEQVYQQETTKRIHVMEFSEIDRMAYMQQMCKELMKK